MTIQKFFKNRELGSNCLFGALCLGVFVFALSGCTSVFFQPDQYLYLTPHAESLEFEEIAVPKIEGPPLAVWKISPTQKPLGVVLQCHGNGQNMTSHFTFLSWLARKGYWVVAFDYSGYGKSLGQPSKSQAVIDARTILRWVNQARQFQGLPRYLVGQSLGGAICLAALTQEQTPLQAMIIDSTFKSYRWIAREKLGQFFLTWPLQWPLSFLVSDDLSPIDLIEKVHTPVLFLHAEDDSVIPVESSQAIFDKANEPKEFWKVKSGGHLAFFSQRNFKDREKILGFLTRWANRGE